MFPDAQVTTTMQNNKSDPPPPKVRNIFSTLRTNQLSPTATRWLETLITTLDAKDLDAYILFMASDVEVIFNNGDTTMRGREAVRTGLAQFWQSFGSLQHEELNIYGTDRCFVHEALNHYTTLDGREVVLRAVACVDRDAEGRIVSLRVYGDQSPLFR